MNLELIDTDALINELMSRFDVAVFAGVKIRQESPGRPLCRIDPRQGGPIPAPGPRQPDYRRDQCRDRPRL